MRLKHSCRSNTNNLDGGCDRRFRWHFLTHAGLLFSHLPSNDLDAILTACTARRTSSISQWCREKGRGGEGAAGTSGVWRREMILWSIIRSLAAAEQASSGTKATHSSPSFFKYVIWLLLQWHAVSQPPTLSPQKTKTKQDIQTSLTFSDLLPKSCWGVPTG